MKHPEHHSNEAIIKNLLPSKFKFYFRIVLTIIIELCTFITINNGIGMLFPQLFSIFSKKQTYINKTPIKPQALNEKQKTNSPSKAG